MRISEMATTMNTVQTSQVGNVTAQTTQGGEEVSDRERDKVGISRFAELLNKLRELQEKDPELFKSTVSELANDVREKAKTATGMDAKMLGNLADDLETAAKTGDLSALQPKAPEENDDFAVSANGTYGPKNGQMPPEPPEDLNGGSSIGALLASLTSRIDEALGA